MSSLRRLLATRAEPAVSAGATHRTLERQGQLALAEQGHAVKVLRGYVDLFAVRTTPAGPGRRYHLFRVEAGGLILGMPALDQDGSRLDVVAVGGLDCEITELEPGSTIDRERLGEWAARMLTSVATTAPELSAIPAAIGTEIDLQADECVRGPARQVAWATLEMGSAAPEGLDGALTVGDPPWPLPPGTWLRALHTARVVIRDADAFPIERLLGGLDVLHQLVIRGLATRLDEEVARAEEQLGLRADLLADRSRAAVLALAGVAAPEIGLHAGSRRGARPVEEACETVAEALGIALQRPGVWPENVDDMTAVLQIARASRVRTRRLRLRAAWWKNETGPIVAFRGPDRHAVAILREADRHVVVDPAEGTRQLLTAPVLSDLSPDGVAFYRPLPGRGLALADLLAFGMRDAGPDVLRIVLAAAALGLLAMALPLLTKILIDQVLPYAEADQVLVCAAAVAVVSLVSSGFQIMQSIATLRLESRLDFTIHAALADRLLRMPVAFFRGYSGGDLAARVLGFNAIRELLTTRAFRGLLALVPFSVGLLTMLFLDPLLGACAMLVAGLRIGIALAVTIIRLRHERESFRLLGWLQGVTLQLVSGVGKLRIANALVLALDSWFDAFARQQRHAIASQRASNWLLSLEAGFPAAATLLIFAASEHFVGSGSNGDLGTFLAFYAAFGLSLAAVGEWVQSLSELIGVVPRLQRLRPILSTPTEAGDDVRPMAPLEGEVEFANVTFRYGEGGPPILDDVSLSVMRGEFVAIVGPSGSGKSTLFRLLLGFERAEAGVIFVDGRSLETLDMGQLRRQIGTVLQHSKLSSGSIYDNICGGARLPIDRVWEIAGMVSLEDDLRAMPMGIHTMVAEGVNTLSGGQRQRILIARALAHAPRLLLMDEATSALDNRTQAVVTQSLARLNVTRIVIAHRLSTVQGADRIVVLDKGRVVQSGTFGELMAAPGIFVDFARRQLLQDE